MEAGGPLNGRPQRKEADTMDERKTYRVMITETRQKVVSVEAISEAGARRRAEDAWRNAEIILAEGDFQGVEFYIIGDSDSFEKAVERIEPKDAAWEAGEGGGHGSA